MSFTTSRTMLKRISDGDEVSWCDFCTTYTPLIRLCGHDCGLSMEECSELVQNVLVAFFKVSKTFRYDPEKGHFRSYLRKIILRCAWRIKGKRARTNGSGKEPPEEFSDSFQHYWDREWAVHVIGEALEGLRNHMEPLSFQAFYLYAIQEVPPEATARRLGLSINAVYIAKSRGIALLRTHIKYNSGGWDDEAL